MRIIGIWATAAALCGLTLTASGAENATKILLQGRAAAADGSALEFRLSGESRERPEGGELWLGERRFRIERVSRHRLIGAVRQTDWSTADGDQTDQYAVLSSSFSAQTATGQPWVSGRSYLGCDQPYNTFLAVYSVAAGQRFDGVPYGELTDRADRSVDSKVYCFISRPPG